MSEVKLSKRQVQMLGFLDQGLSNTEIAQQAGISEHTVKVHMWRLFRRINVTNRGTAAAWWRQNGGPKKESIEEAYARGFADCEKGFKEAMDVLMNLAKKANKAPRVSLAS
jgi:DNA-binding CsgD family transcriptional regulator